MALAILKFLTIEKNRAKFRIDTGTNKFYYLKIGKTVSERGGITWVDSITEKTPIEENDKSNTLINTAKEISVRGDLFNREDCYVQLFSFKNKEGKSPAFSKVIKVRATPDIDTGSTDIYSLSTSINSNRMAENILNPHRNIPHRVSHSKYSKQSSAENILLDIVRLAGPIVMGILSGINGSKQDTAHAVTGNNQIPQIGMFNTLLQALLNGMQNTNTPAPAAAAKSLSLSFTNQNRFLNPRVQQLSRPMVFGIDDALLASVAAPLLANLAGPLLQMLPQLINAENQHKLQEGQQENKFITDILAESNRDMLLQQFLDNQTASGGSNGAGGGIDMNKLMQLLQQAPQQTPQANQVTSPVKPTVAPAPPVVAPPVTPQVATAKSIRNGNFATMLSTNVLLSFEAKRGISINGKDQIVYNKKSDIKLAVKLNVTGNVPDRALNKAIIKFCFKDGRHQTAFEKIFKQKDIMPNSVLVFDFAAGELSHLPPNSPVYVYAEMRWLSSRDIEMKALGTTEIIFAEGYFLKEQGKQSGEEKELTDMKAYRSFWNKVWESPVLDGTGKQDDSLTKYNWELGADMKYSVTLSADHDSNGLMETKMLQVENGEESLTEKINGRMKAGIELSLSELNKMISLWDNQSPLNDEQLAALKTPPVISGNASEFIYNIKLKGRSKERGMVWVVPILKLHNFVLNKVKNTNEAGQVTEVEEETILFPLPVSARILGLKTN
jgi:hypothetical protein